MNKLEGYLFYTCIQKPTKCYEESNGEEWKVTVLVDRDTFDEYETSFRKTSQKKIPTEEFEEQFGVEVPEEYAEQKFQYVITLRKNTKLANGKDVPEIYAPKVLQRKGKAVVDVTQEVLVGNGSKGAVSIDIYTKDEGKYAGSYPRLKNVLVEDLIPYEKKESDRLPADEDPVFGKFETATSKAAAEFDDEAEAEEKPKAKATKAKKKVVADDEDAPF